MMDLYCPLVFFQHGSLATTGIHLSEDFSCWGLQFRVMNRTVLLIFCCVSKLCRELKILNLGHIIYQLNSNFWVKELEIWFLFNLCSRGTWVCNFVFLSFFFKKTAFLVIFNKQWVLPYMFTRETITVVKIMNIILWFLMHQCKLFLLPPLPCRSQATASLLSVTIVCIFCNSVETESYGTYSVRSGFFIFYQREIVCINGLFSFF